MGNPPTPWRVSTGEYFNHAIGRFGEQGLHDWAGREGFVVMYGASGSTRTPRGQPQLRVHQPTTRGIDTVLYRPADHQILVVDNKGDAAAPTGISSAPVGEVSAFTDNLRQKVRNRITNMEAARAGLPPQMAGHMNKVIADLRKVDTALANGGRNWPANVAFAVSNAGGTASGVSPALTARLRAAGIRNIQFIDFRGPRVRQTWLAREAVPFRKFGPRRTRVQGSLTRLPSLARLGLTGFAIAGTVLSMASNASASPALATAAEMFNPKGLLKEAMMQNISKLAQPRPDSRAVSEILRDPATAHTLRVIDVLSKDLRPFTDELAEHHVRVKADAAIDILLLAGRSRGMDAADQAESFSDLEEQLGLYLDDLDVVAENLETASGMAPQVLNAAAGAEQLRRGIPIAAHQLFNAGFTVEEINEMDLNLMRFSTAARSAFADLDALSAKVDLFRNEIVELRRGIWWESWAILLAPLVNGPAPSEPDPSDPEKDRQAVLDVLPDDVGRAIPLAEIKRRVHAAGGDFIPSVERVLADLEASNKVETVSGPGVRDGKVWYRSSGYVHRPAGD